MTILGQGLAGTALAWQLRWRGLPFTIFDRGDTVTASTIAAGIVNPVTGQRLAVDDHFDQYFVAATEFYRRVEAETGTRCFEMCDIVRLPGDASERQKLVDKPALRDRAQPTEVDDAWFRAPHGSYAIPAARLDVPAYLAASRRAFSDNFQHGTVPECDGLVIDCTGIAALREGRLDAELFQPAKGEILTLRIPGLSEDRVVLRGVWLARIAGDVFRAGATYSWEPLDDVPTPAGRSEIELRVAEFLKLPYDVISHDAATRPIARDRKPIVMQLNPMHWAFNGLGSKGVLLAPTVAGELADRLASRPRLTEQVHDILRECVKPGDSVIDATAGNGHDTHLLSELVSESGHVFAFDIQQRALDASAARLSHDNVSLILANHADMAEHIPDAVHGHISAVVFNLGYLPGGEKSISTRAESSCRAIQCALKLLKVNGVLTVMTYVAHDGGAAEDAAVRAVLPPHTMIPSASVSGPRLYVVRK